MCFQAVTTDKTSNALMTVTPVYTAAVAVLDTGVQCNHPDLNVLYTKQFNIERSPDPSLPGACYDGMGHGTHVSGAWCVVLITQ
jgi:subtilisin family serine protease